MRDGSTGCCWNIKQLELWLCVCWKDVGDLPAVLLKVIGSPFFSIPVTNQPKSSAHEDMLPF